MVVKLGIAVGGAEEGAAAGETVVVTDAPYADVKGNNVLLYERSLAHQPPPSKKSLHLVEEEGEAAGK